MSFQRAVAFRPIILSTLRRSTGLGKILQHPLPKNRPPLATSRGFQTTRVARDRSFTNLLADDNPPPVQVSSISDAGIQLVDGLVIPGACIFLEGKVFLWDVPATDLKSKVIAERWKGWGGDLFQILEVVTPRPEMLLLGTGRTLVQPPPFLRSYLNGLGIQLDVMDTECLLDVQYTIGRRETGRSRPSPFLPLFLAKTKIFSAAPVDVGLELKIDCLSPILPWSTDIGMLIYFLMTLYPLMDDSKNAFSW